jgi:hypothetical protein
VPELVRSRRLAPESVSHGADETKIITDTYVGSHFVRDANHAVMLVKDSFVAAIALAHGLTVATRNRRNVAAAKRTRRRSVRVAYQQSRR